jgi:arginyl-tRNA--protein-N-Asp/Glu arginylyltransferase
VDPYFDIRYPSGLNPTELDQLLALGWFRMHQAIFTTSHLQREDRLLPVHWLRYPIHDLRPHRSHQRLRVRNKDFRVEVEELQNVPVDHEVLFARYRASIDFDGAASVTSWLWDDEAPGNSIYSTRLISVYDHQQLIAGGCFDIGQKAAASILHYFDPAYARFSLGRYLMLLTVDFLRNTEVQYYYPGYVVEGDPKMNYKLFLGFEAAQYFDPSQAAWRSLQKFPLASRHFG